MVQKAEKMSEAMKKVQIRSEAPRPQGGVEGHLPVNRTGETHNDLV